MVERKRGSKVRVRGERVGTAKLTEDDVLAIRAMHKSGRWNYNKISKVYNMSREAIRGIVLGNTWKHVGGAS